ncbi:MAG: FUSC family protein [Acidobacteriota bacterium]|nr:FUSC family protein [Acidobacteriota bacterium]
MAQRRFLRSPEVRLSLRAAFCLTSILLVGLWTPARADSTVLALGALWAISQDGLDQWRVRERRLASVTLAAAIGIALGTGFDVLFPERAAVLVLYALTAFVAGLVEASNYPSAGSYLIVGVIVGAGVGFGGHQVSATLLIAAGSLWVYVVAFLMDRRNARTNQRLVLAASFRSVADLFDAVDTDGFADVRARAVAALDAAQDVIGSDDVAPNARRHIDHVDPELLALRQVLVVALQCGEVVSLVAGGARRLDPMMAPTLREIAQLLDEHDARHAARRLDELRRLVDVRGDVSATWRAALRAPAVATLTRRTPFVSQRNLLPRRERLRFAALLATAVAAASALSLTHRDAHSFWLPLAVAFIFRPDLGSVTQRAVARTFGTALGTLIAVVAVDLGNPVALFIGLSCVMAAGVPWAARKSHALSVLFFTPLVFVIVGALRPDKGLFIPRVVDTAVAALIVLVIDFFAWSRAPSLRPRQQVALARRAAEAYEREATIDDALRRHRLRRDALRALVAARGSLASAKREHHVGHASHDALLTRELDEIETSIDATTAQLLSTSN